jgi:hypothetical protein
MKSLGNLSFQFQKTGFSVYTVCFLPNDLVVPTKKVIEVKHVLRTSLEQKAEDNFKKMKLQPGSKSLVLR